MGYQCMNARCLLNTATVTCLVYFIPTHLFQSQKVQGFSTFLRAAASLEALGSSSNGRNLRPAALKQPIGVDETFL